MFPSTQSFQQTKSPPERTAHQPARAGQVPGPALGSGVDRIDRAAECEHEARGDRWIVLVIAKPCSSRLRFRGGMELDAQASVLARDATSSLGPRNRLDLAGIDGPEPLGDLGAPRGLVLARVEILVLVEAAE